MLVSMPRKPRCFRQRPMWQETARRNLRGATGCVCFFFSKIGKHVSLEFTVVIIPHCFCSFLKGGRDSLLMWDQDLYEDQQKKPGVASSIVWSLAGQRTLVFLFCPVSLSQAHGDKPKGNGQRTTVHSVTTSNLLAFQKYDQPEKNILWIMNNPWYC